LGRSETQRRLLVKGRVAHRIEDLDEATIQAIAAAEVPDRRRS
jgi:hypothetical protein